MKIGDSSESIDVFCRAILLKIYVSKIIIQFFSFSKNDTIPNKKNFSLSYR